MLSVLKTVSAAEILALQPVAASGEEFVSGPDEIKRRDRRHAQALVPDLGRGGVVGAVRGAADVGVVRPVDGPEQKPFAGEDRYESRQIGQMAAAEQAIRDAAALFRPLLALSGP